MSEHSAAMKCDKCGNTPHSQDEIYGRGVRLFSRKMNGQWCCSRCGNVKGDMKRIELKGKSK